ncbi:MAG TPA: alpha/beta hydrolase [Steroidobacter sp.]|nr:alpha/beta hydrolase [Steroidobacter sp.]
MIPISARALGVVFFCSATSQLACAAGPLALTECRLESAAAPGGAAARCGRYLVHENQNDPTSRELRIHVAVVPALRLRARPDALFILSGGPGQAASDFYLTVAPAFARIRRDRDIVIVDQRGTGRSNRLDCALPDEGELAGLDTERLQQAVRACLRTLPGNPRYYTTSIAVRDLDEIRAALGYETISLYGVSYGTRVAQHYMRRYPNRVRSAILDGVVPPDLPLGPDIALAAQHALDATLARCAAEAPCSAAFPDIAERFEVLRKDLRRHPIETWVPDPLTAQPIRTALGEQQLSAAVRLLSYSDESASILPLLIHEAQAAARPQALAAHYLMTRRALQEQLAQGMHFSVVCSEDAPRWAHAHVQQAAIERAYMGAEFMQAMRAICGLWPRGPVDEQFGAPLKSAVPTLLLSGGNDPVTPASYALRVLPGFAHAKHLVLKAQGHGQIDAGCVPRVVADFIAAGSVVGLDAACVQNVAPTPFMLSLTAPSP